MRTTSLVLGTAILLICVVALIGCSSAPTIAKASDVTQTQAAQEQIEKPPIQAPDTLVLSEEYDSWEDIIEVPQPLQGVVISAANAQGNGYTLAYRAFIEGVSEQTFTQWQTDMTANDWEQFPTYEVTSPLEYKDSLEYRVGESFHLTDQDFKWLGQEESTITIYFMNTNSWLQSIYNTDTGCFVITIIN